MQLFIIIIIYLLIIHTSIPKTVQQFLWSQEVWIFLEYIFSIFKLTLLPLSICGYGDGCYLDWVVLFLFLFLFCKGPSFIGFIPISLGCLWIVFIISSTFFSTPWIFCAICCWWAALPNCLSSSESEVFAFVSLGFDLSLPLHWLSFLCVLPTLMMVLWWNVGILWYFLLDWGCTCSIYFHYLVLFFFPCLILYSSCVFAPSWTLVVLLFWWKTWHDKLSFVHYSLCICILLRF